MNAKTMVRWLALFLVLPVVASAEPVESRVALTRRHKQATVRYRPLTLPLLDRVRVDGVSQGNLNDCTLIASMAAIAHSRPELIKHMIRPSERLGWIDVAFGGKAARRDLKRGKASEQIVSVRNDAVYQNDQPLYAFDPEKGSSWGSLIEKAYAKYWGGAKGYEALDHGGLVETAMECLAGGSVRTIEVFPEAANDPKNQQGIWREVNRALECHLPTALLSPERGQQQPGGRNVHAWHTYALVGAKTRGEEPWVQLYNPHANKISPRGKFFEMPLQEFVASFQQMFVSQPESEL